MSIVFALLFLAVFYACLLFNLLLNIKTITTTIKHTYEAKTKSFHCSVPFDTMSITVREKALKATLVICQMEYE